MWATMQKLRILSMLMIELSVRENSTESLGFRGGGLPDFARLELADRPERGAEPARVVAGNLGGLDADLVAEDVEDLPLHALADLVEEEVAGQRHAAREDHDVGVEHLDRVRHADGEAFDGPVDDREGGLVALL